VRGRLVEQDKSDEPATELLRRIAAERSPKNEKRARVIEPTDLSGAPFELPAGWTWARFPELGAFARGKLKHRPRNNPSLFEGGTHLLIQTSDVARSNGYVKTYTNKYNEFGLAQELEIAGRNFVHHDRSEYC
jgi:type I restriction enzyme S subunit